MEKNYISADVLDKRIFHRYIENGNHKLEVIHEYPVELFIKGGRDDSVDSISIYGDKLKRIEFGDISDAREFIKNYDKVIDIYGQTSFVHQFLSKEYPDEIKFKIDEFRIVCIDIEVKFDESGFPSPSKANNEISAITLKFFGEKGFIIFGTKDFVLKSKNDIYYKCDNERELLLKFLEVWEVKKPDILTGWNIVAFDIPYLVNRMRKIIENHVNRLSPFHKWTNNVFTKVEITNDEITYRILGINILDYIELYKKFSLSTRESYSLDYISYVELGERKIDYSSEYKNLMDLYERNFQLFIEYNIHDVRLVELLDKKLKFIYLAITLAYIGKIRFHEIFSQVRFWDNIIYCELLKNNIQIPPHREQNQDIEIEGAYVKDPKPGMYHWVASLDLTSLYPSIIMGFNMSPETLRRGAYPRKIVEELINMSFDVENNVLQNCTFAANGSQYTKDFIGIMPKITKSMFADRKKYKNKMLEVGKEIEKIKAEIEHRKFSKKANEYKDLSNDDIETLLLRKTEEKIQYDALQHAFKIALNSLYGAQGNVHFRYFDPNIAEGITLTGQCVIRYISEKINEFLNKILKTEEDYIIANDTDSAYVTFYKLVSECLKGENVTIDKIITFIDKFIEKHLSPYIDKKFNELSQYLRMHENTLNMKREVISDKAIWRAKKNYIIQVYDNEGVRYTTPKLKMMGIETARSSTSVICKKALTDCYEIILNGTENDLIEYVKKFKKEFMNANIEDIAFPRGISDIDKWIDERSGWKTGTPVHVKAAIVYNNLLRKYKLNNIFPEIKNGDKIKFVYLKEPNETMNNAIAFKDKLHPEFGIEIYIDKETQFEKSFLIPLRSFTDILGISLEKKNTLDNFFGISNDSKKIEDMKRSAFVLKSRKKISTIDGFFE